MFSYDKGREKRTSFHAVSQHDVGGNGSSVKVCDVGRTCRRHFCDRCEDLRCRDTFLAVLTILKEGESRQKGLSEAFRSGDVRYCPQPGSIYNRCLYDITGGCFHYNDISSYRDDDPCRHIPEGADNIDEGPRCLPRYMGGALLLVFGNRLMPGGAASAAGAGTSNVWGDLLCLFAQCSYATYLVIFKGLIQKYSPVTLMKWMFTFASVIMLPLSIGRFVSTPWETVPFEQYAGLAFILLGGTFLCYLLMPIGQKTLRPTLVAMYNYVQPVVATMIAVFWGMDSFNIIKLVAIILVFSGVLLVNRSKSRADVVAEEKKISRKRQSPEDPYSDVL